MTTSYSNIFSILFLLVTFESILRWTSILDLPVVVWWIYNVVMIVISFILMSKYSNDTDTYSLLFVKLFIIWVLISNLRGFFVADNYWEYKHLVSQGLTFLISFFIFLFVNPSLVKTLLSSWYKYMFMAFIPVLPFVIEPTIIGQYFSPLLLLLLLLSILPFRWKIFTLILTFTIIVFSLESRSTIIKFGVALLFGAALYMKFIKRKEIFRVLHITFFALPILLLFLGVTNTFNVFNIQKNFNMKVSKQGYSNDEVADTRTFIYVENINSALKHNYVFEGRTPARGYDSPSFGNYFKYVLGTGKMERIASEVSILNIFTWYGIIGVILYFLVFFSSSFLAIYRSNNDYVKVIGLFVSFRWAYAFVEDFSTFGIQTIFLWLLIAMGISEEFRKMTNEEFELWTQDLLEKSKLFTLRN